MIIIQRIFYWGQGQIKRILRSIKNNCLKTIVSNQTATPGHTFRSFVRSLVRSLVWSALIQNPYHGPDYTWASGEWVRSNWHFVGSSQFKNWSWNKSNNSKTSKTYFLLSSFNLWLDRETFQYGLNLVCDRLESTNSWSWSN